ncbi:MAG: hypothetical protein R3F56_17085 [Planctomycetota bacterium]
MTPRPADAQRARAGEVRKATLTAGKTLYALAREHLGDGERWREIAAMNGWTDDDVARLPAGVEVALPAR